MPSVVHKSLDLFLKEMDEAGIDRGVLVSRRAGHRITENEDVAELREQYPDRFPAALAGIDVSIDILAALQEVDRYINDMGFKGINMDPGWCVPPRYVDDRRIYPIYARCAELGCVVYLTVSLRQGPDISYADPIRIQRVANDFPTLKIVVVHAAFPFTNEMLGVMIANYPLGNIWALTDFFVSIPGFAGCKDWVDAANNYMGDRMIWASSYPVRPLKLALEQFNRLSFEPDVLDNLLAKNAADLFEIRT
jgi:predicted TIM-barrel fold metal-dependent hydrolase